jgi:uncharacterized protein YcbX
MHQLQSGRPIGRVVGLWRYPVKSMAGESLIDVSVGWHGFCGDRRWAFVRNNVVNSGFPWFTIRERGDMSRFQPSLVDPAQPDRSGVRVRTPSGNEFDVTDPALGMELCPSGVRVIKQDRGIFDTFPLSLITTQTIDELGARVGAALDVARFRPNIVVEAVEAAPFAEDELVGRTLRIGGMRMRVDKRDGRCAVITVDPVTAERNPEILRTVARDRQGCIGIYGTTVEPGRIAANDFVFADDSDGL